MSERFHIYTGDADSTLQLWKRKLEYLFDNHLKIKSENVQYIESTTITPLSTTISGSTTLTNPLALNTDLIATNNKVNDIILRLKELGIYST